jgi:hypothetical protein
VPEYDYEIGTTSTTTNVESLAVPVNPPRGTFNEWGKTYIRGDGTQVGHGFPRASWQFDYLTQAMIDQLRAFCAAKSAIIYIKTRRYDGTFVKYNCIIHWPEEQLAARGPKGYYQNIMIQFTRLEAV